MTHTIARALTSLFAATAMAAIAGCSGAPDTEPTTTGDEGATSQEAAKAVEANGVKTEAKAVVVTPHCQAGWHLCYVSADDWSCRPPRASCS